MKTKKTFFMPLVLILLFSINTQAQNLRHVSYSTVISKVFAVPAATNIEDINSAHLLKMRWADKTQTTEAIIDQGNMLNITIFHHETPRYEYDYEYNIGKTLQNGEGVYVFDHDDNPLYELIHEAFDEEFMLSNQEIESYGIFTLFNEDLNALAAAFEAANFTVSFSPEEVLTAINDGMEIYIDPVRLIYEIRYFENFLLQVSDWKKYQESNGYIIPMVFVMTTYEEVENQLRIQTSEITRFKQYFVADENNNILVDHYADIPNQNRKGEIAISKYKEIAKKPAELKVFPNPSSDYINIEIPLYLSSCLDIEIIGPMGERVYYGRNMESGTTHTIDVSAFSAGIYLVRCGREGKFKTSRFIKQ